MATQKLDHVGQLSQGNPSGRKLTSMIKFIASEGGLIVSDASPPSALRSDARRNVDRIRVAATTVFRERGLSAPLEEIAAVANVSKATIFNRLGGRVGLIDAVLDDVVAAEMSAVIDEARSVTGVRERIRWYVRAIRDLQYRVPAVNDVLLQEYPDSKPLVALCRVGGEFHDTLVEQGHAVGVLVDGFTSGDFQALTHNNALALKHGELPPRADYDRRTEFVIAGICRPTGAEG
ncbi:TetR/AcrR family transcriptional regulator [Microbacterium sp. NPDC058342]|uniref:TetR/AcrR family transcriptional regulator n=1 Tax=Microbacterium sp. NPDC058342 TaxID=3346454 RepID=UPI00364D906D